jgi:hypothetical protein
MDCYLQRHSTIRVGNYYYYYFSFFVLSYTNSQHNNEIIIGTLRNRRMD